MTKKKLFSDTVKDIQIHLIDSILDFILQRRDTITVKQIINQLRKAKKYVNMTPEQQDEVLSQVNQ